MKKKFLTVNLVIFAKLHLCSKEWTQLNCNLTPFTILLLYSVKTYFAISGEKNSKNAHPLLLL
jgi:hypothetical protein